MAISYLNGEWFPVGEAYVSAMDRGFLFGDGVYEVVPVYNKKSFCLERHVARLAASLEQINLVNPHTEAEWMALFDEAIDRSGETYAAFYVQVTRGVDDKRDFVYPETTVPTVYMMVNPAPQLQSREVTAAAVITLDDYRWNNGQIKTISLIAAGMLKNEAVRQGAKDAVLIKDGFVTECTAANIFVVLEGVIVTPPKSSQLLHGITRDVVIELAKTNGLAIEERAIKVEELATASEMFYTSSTQEAWPIGRINGEAVGNGEPGIVWQKLDVLFQAHKLK